MLLDGCNHIPKCGTPGWSMEFCFICGEPATHDSGHWNVGSQCPRFGHPDDPATSPIFDEPQEEQQGPNDVEAIAADQAFRRRRIIHAERFFAWDGIPFMWMQFIAENMVRFHIPLYEVQDVLEQRLNADGLAHPPWLNEGLGVEVLFDVPIVRGFDSPNTQFAGVEAYNAAAKLQDVLRDSIEADIGDFFATHPTLQGEVVSQMRTPPVDAGEASDDDDEENWPEINADDLLDFRDFGPVIEEIEDADDSLIVDDIQPEIEDADADDGDDWTDTDDSENNNDFTEASETENPALPRLTVIPAAEDMDHDYQFRIEMAWIMHLYQRWFTDRGLPAPDLSQVLSDTNVEISFSGDIDAGTVHRASLERMHFRIVNYTPARANETNNFRQALSENPVFVAQLMQLMMSEFNVQRNVAPHQ